MIMHWWHYAGLFLLFFVSNISSYRRGYKHGYNDGFVTAKLMTETSPLRRSMMKLHDAMSEAKGEKHE